MENMSSAWSSLPPLILVGAGFLVIMEMAGRENRRAGSVAAAQQRPTLRWEIIALLVIASMAHIPVVDDVRKRGHSAETAQFSSAADSWRSSRRVDQMRSTAPPAVESQTTVTVVD